MPRNPNNDEAGQREQPMGLQLSIKIEDAHDSWAVCNQPSTVAPSRFSQFKGEIPLLPKEDFNQVIELLAKWLPVPFKLDPSN
jgi:hypothetical protein